MLGVLEIAILAVIGLALGRGAWAIFKKVAK